MGPVVAASASEAVEASRETLELARSGTGAAAPGLLRDLDPTRLDGDGTRVAFWINLYNATILRELGERPRRGSLIRHARLFDSAAVEVGRLEYSLNVIEHGLLRRNARPPYALRPTLRRGDPRRLAAPSRLDPRIHFALNCGARSCPPIRAYAAASCSAQLGEATRGYLAAELVIDRERDAVTLPGLMKLYRADFGSREVALSLCAEHLPDGDGDWLRERISSVRVRYARFDWTIV